MKILLPSALLLILFRLWAHGEHIGGAVRPTEMRFTENRGQWDARVQYQCKIPNGTLFLEKSGFTFSLYSSEALAHRHHRDGEENGVIHGHAFRERFIGSNPNVRIAGDNPYADYANYYLSNDPSQWATGVKIFGQVKYHQLYPGIDLVMKTRAGELLKYDLMVSAGADASVIKMKYEGLDDIRIKNGELWMKTSVGEVTEQKPYAYQEINGVKTEVTCRFRLQQDEVTFEFPSGYNPQYELVIDPNVVFSSYTGSTADNFGFTATYDLQSDLYLGGIVFAFGYPTTTGAFQTNYSAVVDVSISKFTATGNALMYSTYLGGNGTETPSSLIVNNRNELLVLGTTGSTNFPTSVTGYDRTFNGGAYISFPMNGATYNSGTDIFVTCFNTTGTSLVGSTYIGGTANDGINANSVAQLQYNYGDQFRGEIIVDDQNNVYVASTTLSTNFPTTAGVFQPASRGLQEGVVFKMNSNLSGLIWSSYVGGTGVDAAYSIKLDNSQNVFVCGGTTSNNLNNTTGALNPAFRGVVDGFIAKINNSGTTLDKTTYIGTTAYDQCYFIETDRFGNIYTYGQTSGLYPVTPGVYSNPNTRQFIHKLTNNLSSTIFSTTFGAGSLPNISPTAFLVDTCGHIYASGWGGNTNRIWNSSAGNTNGMPTTSDAFKPTTDGSDFYFIVLGPDGLGLKYATFFGGSGADEHVDGGTSRFDKRGAIYQAVCAGCGGNSLFPTTPGAWSNINRSTNCNALGLKIEFNLTGTRVSINAFPRATGCVPLTVQFQSNVTNAQSIVWHFGDGTTSTAANPSHTYTDTGTYKVMLIGLDSNTCNISDTAFLDVWVRHDSLSANFTPYIQINCDSNALLLTSSGSPTTRHNWNMGDNTTYTTKNVFHKYNAPGTYTIRLIVSDSTKCNPADTFVRQVTIPPVVRADFSPQTSRGCVPHTANFSVPNIPTATYRWYFGDGGTANTASVSHTYTSTGTYQVMLIVTDSNSCNKIDTAYGLVITNDSAANAGFQYTRTFISCDTVLLTAWSTYRGEEYELWDFGDGTQALNIDTVNHIYTTAGTFIITHYIRDDDMSCKPLDTSRITISLNPLSMAVSVRDTGGCAPLRINLTGNSGLSTTRYFWFFGDGDSTSGSSISHTYTQPGSYRLKVVAVDTNTCTGVDSSFAQITILGDSVRADFRLNILNQCDSNLVVDLVNQSVNGSQYYWTFGDGTSSVQTNENHTYRQPGTYYIKLVVVGTGQCNSVDSIVKPVTLLPNSYADFLAEDICVKSAVQFVNLSNPSARFVWRFGDARSSTAYSPAHQYQSPGTYTVLLIMTDSASCNVTDSVTRTVRIYDQPTAGFLISNDTFKFEAPIRLRNNSINYNKLLWDMGDGTTIEDELTPTYTYESPGRFTICITASNDDCIDTMCRQVYISYTGLIGVPNAFSPNGDGINDVVKVEGKGIVKLMFRIFNRWGEKVFETDDKNEGWNGLYKGVLQEMDAYTFTVEATLADGRFVPLKGNITLLR